MTHRTERELISDIAALAYENRDLEAEAATLRQRVAELEGERDQYKQAYEAAMLDGADDTTADDVQPLGTATNNDKQPLPYVDAEILPPPRDYIRIYRGGGYSAGRYEVTGRTGNFIHYRNGLGNIATVKASQAQEVA